MAVAVMAVLAPLPAAGALPIITYGQRLSYANGHGSSSWFYARPAFWTSPNWAPGAHLHYAYTSTFNSRADLKVVIDAEMTRLNGTMSGNEYNTWANVPHFYLAEAGDTPNIYFTYVKLATGTAGYRSGNTIKINTDFGANAMAGIVAHEMGHMYGFWHTSMGFGPGPDLSIMSQGIYPKLASWTRYGSCDMAGLQAKYGIGEAANQLSSCLPPFALSGPSFAGRGSSITLTSTPSGTTTTYYKDWPYTTAYTGTVNFEGLCRSVHLYGVDAGGTSHDYGHGTPSGTNCTWTVTSFSSGYVGSYHVGAPGLTAPITDPFTVILS